MAFFGQILMTTKKRHFFKVKIVLFKQTILFICSYLVNIVVRLTVPK